MWSSLLKIVGGELAGIVLAYDVVIVRTLIFRDRTFLPIQEMNPDKE